MSGGEDFGADDDGDPSDPSDPSSGLGTVEVNGGVSDPDPPDGNDPNGDDPGYGLGYPPGYTGGGYTGISEGGGGYTGQETYPGQFLGGSDQATLVPIFLAGDLLLPLLGFGVAAEGAWLIFGAGVEEFY